MEPAGKKKIRFITNPISGGGKQQAVAAGVEKYLDKQKFSYDIVVSDYAGHSAVLAAEAVSLKYDAVVAVGGDGSVHEVGTRLIHSSTALGIIPTGSGNGVARSLEIPAQLEKSIETINNYQLKTIDSGIINEVHHFIGVAGIGFDALIGSKFLKLKSRGLPAYIKLIAQEFLTYEGETVEISIDGKEYTSFNTFVMAIANTSQYGNNAFIAPEADPSSGVLQLVAITEFPLLQAPIIVSRLFTKSIHKSPYVKVFNGSEFYIQSKSGLMHLDGEPEDIGNNIHIKTDKASLNVIC